MDSLHAQRHPSLSKNDRVEIKASKLFENQKPKEERSSPAIQRNSCGKNIAGILSCQLLPFNQPNL
jgi:hypothetical protein